MVAVKSHRLEVAKNAKHERSVIFVFKSVAGELVFSKFGLIEIKRRPVRNEKLLEQECPQEVILDRVWALLDEVFLVGGMQDLELVLVPAVVEISLNLSLDFNVEFFVVIETP